MAEDSTVDRVIHDLKLLSTLRENDRVYVCDGLLCIHPPGPWTALHRWARGDSRAKSLAAVQRTLFDALKLAECAVEPDTRSSFRNGRRAEIDRTAQKGTTMRLYKELRRATAATEHLRTTYIEDRSVAVQLDVLRERVTERLEAMREFIEDSSSSRPKSPLVTSRRTSQESTREDDYGSGIEWKEERCRRSSTSSPASSGDHPFEGGADRVYFFDGSPRRVLEISNGDVVAFDY